MVNLTPSLRAASSLDSMRSIARQYIDLINVYNRPSALSIVDGMETLVRDLMTSPVVTCASDESLAVAARLMHDADIGSIVVTERPRRWGSSPNGISCVRRRGWRRRP